MSKAYRMEEAVRRASRARILDDMRRAAWAVQAAVGSAPCEAIGAGRYAPAGRPVHITGWSRGYVLGYVEGCPSASLAACVLTAFGV